MAAKASEPTTPVQHIQHERFTTKQHGYRLFYLSLGVSGNIAVSGFNINSRRTYIDLYSGNSSDSRDKLKLFYSKEFEKYSRYRLRFVSFLDKNVSKLVTCIGDKIEIIDAKNEGKVLRFCRVNGKTMSLAVREGEIFIGLAGSQTVLVFNNDLKEAKKIRIKGIQDGDYPWHLQVIKDTVFVRTRYGRALSLSVYDGSIVSEYTDTTGIYSFAISIAVSEEISLVAVVWYKRPAQGIIVYSLNKNKSFLVFDVDYDVTRIRISHRDRMIITGNQETGEIKMYDLEQLFSFEAMKSTLAYIVSPEECEELRKCFGVTEEEIRRLEAGDEDKELSDKQKTVRKMECIFTVMEEKGHLNSCNVNKLTDAVSKLGDEIRIPDLKGPLEGYSLHGIGENMKITMTKMMTRQKAWKEERIRLSSRLETAESKVKEHEKTLDVLQGELVRVINKAQEQELMFREDLKIGELKTKELEGGTMRFTEALQLSYEQMETLTEELKKIQMKFTHEMKTLQNELKRTIQSKTKSDKQIQTMTEELTQIRIDSTEKIETLTRELKQTQMRFAAAIETLEGEFKQTNQSKTDSAKEREALAKDLRQIKTDSHRQIKTMREELETLKEELTEVKRESTKTEMLTEELETIREELKTMTKELTELRKESDTKIEMLTAELEQTQMKSATEIETLTEELSEVKRESDSKVEMLTQEQRQTQIKSAKEIETLTKVLRQVKRESDTKMDMLTEEQRQTQMKSATEIGTLTEELREVKRESDTKIAILTQELRRTQLKSATDTETLKEVLTRVKRESDTKIEMLTQALQHTQVNYATEIETLTKKLTEVKRESDTKIDILTQELRRTQLKSETEIETLTKELREVKREPTKIEMLTQELEQTHMKSETRIETLTEKLTQVKRKSGTKIEMLTEELEQTRAKFATKIETLTEELTQVKGESDTKIEMLTEELEQTQAKSATEIETLKGQVTEMTESLMKT